MRKGRDFDFIALGIPLTDVDKPNFFSVSIIKLDYWRQCSEINFAQRKDPRSLNWCQHIMHVLSDYKFVVDWGSQVHCILTLLLPGLECSESSRVVPCLVISRCCWLYMRPDSVQPCLSWGKWTTCHAVAMLMNDIEILIIFVLCQSLVLGKHGSFIMYLSFIPMYWCLYVCLCVVNWSNDAYDRVFVCAC